MKKLLALSPVLAALLLAAPAGAAIVTVGTPLNQPFTDQDANLDVTIAQTTLPGALVASPVSGTVIAWRGVDLAGGPYRLRVLRPDAAGAYTGVAAGPPVTTAAAPLTTFAAGLPIQAGDVIGLDAAEGAHIGEGEVEGAVAAGWGKFLLDGTTRAPDDTEKDVVFGFNADVLPAPTITVVSPAGGSFKGGGAVTIEGTNLIQVSAVSFGGVPAAGFSSESEGRLTAIAPAVKKPAAAEITLTTPAGTAAAATKFVYEACKVPNLTGKKTRAVRKKLKAAHCKLGHVKRIAGNSGKVTKQKPKPGTLKAPGAKIKVTLG